MNKAKTMAPTPEAPITLGTTMRPAPLLEALVEVVLGELLDLTVVVVSGFDVLGDGKPVDDPLEGVEEPPVVTVPLISAATVALNVPVIPVRVNLAENASALPVPLVAARLLDVKRRKYPSELPPTVGSGVHV
jgi:hypothetical protein